MRGLNLVFVKFSHKIAAKTKQEKNISKIVNFVKKKHKFVGLLQTNLNFFHNIC